MRRIWLKKLGPKKLALGTLIAAVAIVAALPILRPRCT
jgi:hypothetical protein